MDTTGAIIGIVLGIILISLGLIFALNSKESGDEFIGGAMFGAGIASLIIILQLV